MAEMTQPSISTTSITTESPPSQPVPVVLRLQKPKTDKKVQWMEGVVDNEFLGRKSSKCCCIYTDPNKTNDSDSDDDDNCCHEHKVARRHVPHKN
jgi:protein phosphatase 1 regulatory subunit 11